MEIAKLEVLIGGDIKPLQAALAQGEAAIQDFAGEGADAFLNLNVGLSNTARSAMAAATDIKTMSAALDVLQAEQSGIVRGTTLWQLYETEIKKANAQLDIMEAELPVVATEMKAAGAATGGIGSGLTKAFTGLRQLAYILPGIGIAGIFNLAFEAISKAAEELDIFNSQTKELAAANKAAIEDISKESNQVEILVRQLRTENLTRQEKLNNIQKLQDIAPAYFSNLRLEGDNVVSLTDDYANFGRAIILVAKIKAASDLNQKNVTAGIEQQLHTSERLLLLEQKRAYAEKNGVDVGEQRLKILEDDLEAYAKINAASKPLVDIITEAERELNALGGNPLEKPVAGAKELNKQFKETEAIVTRLGALPFFNQIAIDQGDVLAPKDRNLDKIPALMEQIKTGSIDADQAIKDMANNLGLLGDAAAAIGNAFGEVFHTLVTQGKLSFKAIENALASLIAKLIATIVEAAILAAILNAIFPGAGSFGSIFGKLSGFGNIIPHAEGGIFDKPTLIGNQLFGEKGPEALIPLDRLASMVGGLGGNNITINGELRAHGTDLVVALNRGNVRIGRNYGSNFTN